VTASDRNIDPPLSISLPTADGGRERPDAVFFGIGARLSDLDKLQGRLIICIQTNSWAIPSMPTIRPMDLSRRRAPATQGRSGP
jgi:hypothetical protein